MEEKAKSTGVDDHLHAIWSVSIYLHIKVLFCIEQLSASIIPLEMEFFETVRPGKGFHRVYCLKMVSLCFSNL